MDIVNSVTFFILPAQPLYEQTWYTVPETGKVIRRYLYKILREGDVDFTHLTMGEDLHLLLQRTIQQHTAIPVLTPFQMKIEKAAKYLKFLKFLLPQMKTPIGWHNAMKVMITETHQKFHVLLYGDYSLGTEEQIRKLKKVAQE